MYFCFKRTIFSGGRADVDEAKLEKLLKRQKIYGDITQVRSERERECCVPCKWSSAFYCSVFSSSFQSASREHLEDLLSICNNEIPEVGKASHAFLIIKRAG